VFGAGFSFLVGAKAGTFKLDIKHKRLPTEVRCHDGWWIKLIALHRRSKKEVNIPKYHWTLFLMTKTRFREP
jgi:hypothetical protein